MINKCYTQSKNYIEIQTNELVYCVNKCVAFLDFNEFKQNTTPHALEIQGSLPHSRSVEFIYVLNKKRMYNYQYGPTQMRNKLNWLSHLPMRGLSDMHAAFKYFIYIFPYQQHILDPNIWTNIHTQVISKKIVLPESCEFSFCSIVASILTKRCDFVRPVAIFPHHSHGSSGQSIAVLRQREHKSTACRTFQPISAPAQLSVSLFTDISNRNPIPVLTGKTK